jgi:hypothetical protein
LSLTRYRGDKHEALFRGRVHSVGDLVEGLCEVPYREGLAETFAMFVPLPVVLRSGVFVVIGFISRCIGRQTVC